MTNEHSLSDPDRTPWVRIVALSVGAVALLSLLLTAFAWPATHIEPRDVPVAVAGPEAAVQQVETRLQQERPGAIDVVAVADQRAARDAIADREVYGAVVLDPSGPPTVLTASVGSPLVAQILGQVASGFAAGQGDADGQGAAQAATARVEDVAPLPSTDPRGAGLAAGALPLALGGVAVAGLFFGLVRGAVRRIVGVLLVSVLAGPVLVGILHEWLGALTGDFWLESGVVALGIGATALGVLGLAAMLGPAGMGLGAATIVLLGNPLSAATSAPELLPEGWGDLGQALPPGAVVNALRSVSGFDGAGIAEPLAVLATWAVGGALLVLFGGAFDARRARRSRQDAEPAADTHPIFAQ